MLERPRAGEERHRALVELRALQQRAQALGNDDYESRAIEQLIADVEQGRLDAAKAAGQAQAMIDAKQR